MKLKEFIKELGDERTWELYDIKLEDALEMEIEFNTINRGGLELLSIFESEGKVSIDVGTEEDNDENNEMMCG